MRLGDWVQRVFLVYFTVGKLLPSTGYHIPLQSCSDEVVGRFFSNALLRARLLPSYDAAIFNTSAIGERECMV
jgi:hypothetical protein